MDGYCLKPGDFASGAIRRNIDHKNPEDSHFYSTKLSLNGATPKESNNNQKINLKISGYPTAIWPFYMEI
ncbi:MAG: hypothetical protein BGO40_12965 [Chryseobacterium sp. 39-10]|nr:MAG: hypothetical protein BGO40_12965 [Chryseobacterium sp. 39-10]